ncbi:MAG: hypothetical protein IPJ79_06870 [Bacteroidetes bacterium]|nr:hypothetical protein [Bacteroidota bacterium]
MNVILVWQQPIPIIILIGLYPVFASDLGRYLAISFKNDFRYDYDWSRFFKLYWSWYVFIVAFFIMCKRRAKELVRYPATFDLAKFSLYQGEINPKFYSLFGRQWNIRQIETKLEPAFFFSVGLIIKFLIAPGLGLLIVACSFIYALSYWAAYKHGDGFVLDKIDEMICNQNMHKSFVQKLSPEQTQYFRFVGMDNMNESFKTELMPYFFDDNNSNIGVVK